MTPMAIPRDHDEARAARVDHLLERLRLSTETLHELAKEAVERARVACHAAETIVEKLQAEHVARHAAKKP
jgi:hypothetical protein